MPIQFVEDPTPVKFQEDTVANTARQRLGIRGLTAEMVKAGMGKSEPQGPNTPGFLGSLGSVASGLIPTMLDGGPTVENLGSQIQDLANNSGATTPMQAINALNPMSMPMTQLGEGNLSGLLGTGLGMAALSGLTKKAGSSPSSPVETLSPPSEPVTPTWGQNAASELGSYLKRKIPGYDAVKTISNVVKGPKQPTVPPLEPPTSGLAKLSLADPMTDPSNLPAIPGAGLKKPMPAMPSPPSTPLSDIYNGQTPPTASASIGLANPDSFLSKVTSGYDPTNPQITNAGQDVSPPFMGDAEFGMAKNGTATPPRNVGNKFLSSTPDPTKNIIGGKEEYLHADDAKPGRILKRSPVVESEQGQSGGEPLVRVDSITPDKQAAIVSSKTKDGTWIQKTIPIRRFDLKPPKP